MYTLNYFMHVRQECLLVGAKGVYSVPPIFDLYLKLGDFGKVEIYRGKKEKKKENVLLKWKYLSTK